MPRIEDYALIGDTHSAALVSKAGSIDWLCWPRFDSAACFAALLGDEQHGRWLLAPQKTLRVTRRYLPDTLVLETELETETGVVRVLDCMPPRSAPAENRDGHERVERGAHLIRQVTCIRGHVAMYMQLIIRFDYGWILPWVRQQDGALTATAGPDAMCLRCPVTTVGEDMTTVARFELREGEQVPFSLSWYPSHMPTPAAVDVAALIATTQHGWQTWIAKARYEGPWKEQVKRSLITLKALTYHPTGGIVAAPTTSLPEAIGGTRNWDYRYCWLRDATFTLYSLMLAGYVDEAAAWRAWLLRAAAGDPAKLQIMYGPAGERRIPELELPWLPGYEGSAPVRIGNAAVEQCQLDVFGEIMDALHQATRGGIASDDAAWALQRNLLEFLEAHWQEPDEGIWEVRGPRRQFTHSKVMAWVAFDRAVRSVEEWGVDGPVERWREVRAAIAAEVCERGYDAERNTFTQYYGSRELDASLLQIALVGFLPASDPRVQGTVAAIERELSIDGFVRRYTTKPAIDGLPHGEGAFLACTFWLADNYALLGRSDEARAIYERLLTVCNDVGLLAEEYDPIARRQLGNFPQAFSHVGLINTAFNLSGAGGPAHYRASNTGNTGNTNARPNVVERAPLAARLGSK